MTKRIPPMIVCPYCGPENIMYAGRVLSMICCKCVAEMNAHSGLLVDSANAKLVKDMPDEDSDD